jgi:hypothetical protein
VWQRAWRSSWLARWSRPQAERIGSVLEGSVVVWVWRAAVRKVQQAFRHPWPESRVAAVWHGQQAAWRAAPLWLAACWCAGGLAAYGAVVWVLQRRLAPAEWYLVGMAVAVVILGWTAELPWAALSAESRLLRWWRQRR